MIYFKIFKFQGSKSAQLVLKNMELPDTAGFPLREEEIALISVNGNGLYSIVGSWSKDYNIFSNSVDYFTPMSNLIGIIFGPNGAFANVKVDESIEKLIGHITNIEINDPVLKELEASMGTDVSLLAVLGSRSIIEMLNEELIEYDSETFEITLSDGIQASIEANT